ncbi:MAG: FAD-dependent oxidoreductase [Mangrovibacterium sp.]
MCREGNSWYSVIDIDMQNRRKFLKLAGSGVFFSATAFPANSNSQRVSRDKRVEPYDLIVCGGGPSGCAAALSAAGTGMKVLLVEMQAQLGGTGTSGLVSHWLGGRNIKGEWVVGGIFKSLTEEAQKKGIALIPGLNAEEKYQPHGWYKSLGAGIPFDPYAVAALLDEKMIQHGVDVLLMTKVIDVKKGKNKIESIFLNNKSGTFEVSAKAYIDCTGDGDVMAMCGCNFIKGNDDQLMAPASLMFHVYHADQDMLADYIIKNDAPRFKKEIQKLRDEGKWNLPVDIFISVQMLEKGSMMINTSRLTRVDGTDGESISQGLMSGRRETYELFDLMKKHFPGFRDARIRCVSGMLGIRETRRLKGDFILTVNDLVFGKSFEDTIGYSAYGWDLPDPVKPSVQPMNEKKIKVPERTPIPYRIMLPKGTDNLVCAGRIVSVERDVLGPLRVTAPCMAMGEAAGMAAKQVIERNISFSKVDIQSLKESLLMNGVLL